VGGGWGEFLVLTDVVARSLTVIVSRKPVRCQYKARHGSGFIVCPPLGCLPAPMLIGISFIVDGGEIYTR